MADSAIDRETLLDIMVNIIPMFILLFFIILFAVWIPWSGNSVIIAIQQILTIVPFVLLGLLTWIAAHYL